MRDTVILRPELQPGIWEINVYAAITARDASTYKLTVSFDGYDAPAAVTALERGGTGEAAEASITVMRTFPGVLRGDATAAVEGFRRETAVEIADADTWPQDFKLDRTTPRARFRLDMDAAMGNLFTDCAVNILDADGRVLEATGFDGLEVEVGAELPAGADEAGFTLEVVGAFALAQDLADWGFNLEEKYFLARPATAP